MIVHDDMDKDGNNIKVVKTREEVIRIQIKIAETKGFIYPNEEEALLDYMVINYAWEE